LPFSFGSSLLPAVVVYMIVAGQRSKKWKSLYFVLNASEQQLYYFDNQKVNTPDSSSTAGLGCDQYCLSPDKCVVTKWTVVNVYMCKFLKDCLPGSVWVSLIIVIGNTLDPH